MESIIGRLERKPWLAAVLLWLAALVLLVLCSFNTSPLNPFYGGDSNIFAVLGRMTSQGALPYAGVYDHKGPLVFYIHALGALISHGKAGMLLLQSLALAAGMLLTYRICRLWGTALQSAAGLALFAVIYAACLWGGDMTEEYSLPLALLPSYILLRALKNNDGVARFPARAVFLAGLGIGLLAMLRLNNAAPIFGALVGVLACVRTPRDLPRLFALGQMALLGLLLGTFPLAWYFAVHGALDSMLMGTFIHNINYTLDHTADRSLRDTLEVLAKLSSLALFVVLLVRGRRAAPENRGARWGLAGFVALSILVPACGPLSSHYFIMAAPAIGLVFVLFLNRMQGRRRTLATLCCAAFLLLPFAMDAVHLLAGFRRYNLIRDYQAEIDDARRLAALIPAAERDCVWACDVHASIYVYGNLTPCCPYFTRQSIHGRHNPDIAPAIERMMNERPPRWLIVPQDSFSDQPAVQRALRSGAYTLIHHADTLHLDLWRHK